ncbi:MAG: ArsA-related P-loop ATPase [Oscillospiraceae bacterium]
MAFKLIGIWGSSGSGKSTLALTLATQIAAAGKNVVIISTDPTTPSLPVFLPDLKTTPLHLFGKKSHNSKSQRQNPLTSAQ